MKRLFLFFATFLVCVTWPIRAEAQTPVAINDVPLNSLILWFNGTPCPDGYVRFDNANNRFIRIDPFNPGSTGGASSHQHFLASGSALGGSVSGFVGTTLASTPAQGLLVYPSVGGSAGFNAGNTTNTVNHTPPYYNLVLCQKVDSYEIELPEPSAITATITFTPTYVESPYAYTTTLDTGNNFRLERSVTYGDIISGAGSILVFALLVILGVWRLFHDRNA